MSVENARAISSQWIPADRPFNREFKFVNVYILVEEHLT